MDPSEQLRAHLQLDEQVRLQLPEHVHRHLLTSLAPQPRALEGANHGAPTPGLAPTHLTFPDNLPQEADERIPTPTPGAVPVEMVAPAALQSTAALSAGRVRQVGPNPPVWSSRSTGALEAQLLALRSAGTPQVPSRAPAGPHAAQPVLGATPLPPVSHHGLQRTADEAPMAPPPTYSPSSLPKRPTF